MESPEVLLQMSDNPLHIEIQGVGKKFYQRWLFREIHHDFSKQAHLAIVGKNGSGKSTLLRIISGQMKATEGNISYALNSRTFSSSSIYQYLSWAGPHVELYLDLTWEEQVGPPLPI